MDNIFDALVQDFGEDVINKISAKAGVDASQAQGVVDTALPLLVSALAGNTKTKDGADSLTKALEKDHDGSIFDALDFGKDLKGDKILKHVLGGKLGGVEKFLGEKSNMDTGQATDILKMVAPLVMGGLGKLKKEQGFDADGLAKMLQVAGGKAAGKGGSDWITMLLDKDKDGDVKDDIFQMIYNFIMKFFKK